MLTRNCHVLDGIWDQSGTRGTLSFDPETRRLRFNMTDPRGAKWIEKRVGSGLKERIRMSEAPLLFDVSVDDREIKWPRNFGGRVMKVDDGTHTWLVHLTIQGGAGFLMFGGKEASQPWKDAFASAGVL